MSKNLISIFVSAVKLYLGPEGVVKVDDKIVPLPYEKVFRGKKKESISVIKAGSSVSSNSILHLQRTISVNIPEVPVLNLQNFKSHFSNFIGTASVLGREILSNNPMDPD